MTLKNKPTGGLVALCVLSWIYIGFDLLNNLWALTQGPMTDEQLREEKLNMLVGQTQESIEMMGDSFDQMMAILEVTRDNMYLISSLNVVFYILGAYAVFLMYKLKKLGFHLYIIYSILTIGLSTYFYVGFPIAAAGILLVSVFSVLFVILYSRQLKTMN